MGIALEEGCDSYACFLRALGVLYEDRVIVYSCSSILGESWKETDGKSGFFRCCEESPKRERGISHSRQRGKIITPFFLERLSPAGTFLGEDSGLERRIGLNKDLLDRILP